MSILRTVALILIGYWLAGCQAPHAAETGFAERPLSGALLSGAPLSGALPEKTAAMNTSDVSLGGLRTASLAAAAANRAASQPFMTTGEEVTPPFGFIAFCQRHPAECASRFSETPLMALSDLRWEELYRLNARLNAEIRPVEDIDLHQVMEHWSYPTGQAGDCEDYVLAKRAALIARGWPAHALLIGVALESDGSGHAVLVAVTDRGDLVLDNKTDAIRLWHETPYAWVMRQSRDNAYSWVDLQPSSRT